MHRPKGANTDGAQGADARRLLQQKAPSLGQSGGGVRCRNAGLRMNLAAVITYGHDDLGAAGFHASIKSSWVSHTASYNECPFTAGRIP